MRLLHELRRRRVFGTVALYIVAAWVVIQVAAELFPGLDIPDRAIRYVWLAAVLCFPVAVVFAWRYQITGRGISRTAPYSAGEKAENMRLGGGDYAMLVGLGVLILVILVRAVQSISTVDEIAELSAFGREIHPNSIAVLPLDNLTGDDEQQYIVAGIHESLTSALSGISGLRVKSRTSTASYKDSNLELTEIAHELGVTRVVAGSVLRDGGSIRINVQLIDAATDEYIWTESYERDVRDMLALPLEVAREVAREVSVELTPAEAARLRQTREVDPEVYETYAKGMYFVKRLDGPSIMHGMDLLHETVAIDPAEPLAYAGLALGYNTIGHGVSTHDAFPKAIAAAEKALELDELSGEAWAALGEAKLYYEWDWENAEQAFLRALQLSPSLDHAYAHYAYLLLLLDRVDEAVEMSEKARDLSPVDPLWAGFTAWIYLLDEDRWDEAEETAEECLSFQVTLDLCRYALGQVYSARGEYAKAVAIHEEIHEGDPFRDWALSVSYALAGDFDEAQSIIDRMTVNPTPRAQMHIAFAYAAMGEIEQAVTWLNVAYENRADWLPWIVFTHSYGGAVEPMRDHPGFRAIVGQMHIPAANPSGG
jgi:TolB-like protein/tetratricopeptide (TPR) repeat protein